MDIELTEEEWLNVRIALVHYASEMRRKDLNHTANAYRKLYDKIKSSMSR